LAVNSSVTELQSPCPDFSLPGTDGKTYSLESFKDAQALCVMFICNHCPYVQAVEDRLITLAKSYKANEVAFVAISSNDATRYPDDSFEAMKKRSEEKSYPFPYLYDESQSVAKAFDAVCTPDLYVYDNNRRLTYRGRLDDSWKDPKNVQRTELKWAIDATLKNQRLDFTPVPSMGCSIKWKEHD
jgi:peroxiredoxin